MEKIASGELLPEPPRRLGGGGDVYRLIRDGNLVWAVSIGFGAATYVPFHEEVVWERGGAVAIGGGDRVYLLDVETGELQRKWRSPPYLVTSRWSSDRLLLVLRETTGYY